MRVRLPGLYIVLGLVLAGLIHIVAVLTLPMLAPKNAHATAGGARARQHDDRAARGSARPAGHADDGARRALCLLPLRSRQWPVRLKATVADDLWLIALYTPEGDNFYSVAGADMKRAEIDLVIAAADQTVEEAERRRSRDRPTRSSSSTRRSPKGSR